MATGHVKTFRSQKYKIKTTKPVPVSRLEGTEFFECLNQFSFSIKIEVPLNLSTIPNNTLDFKPNCTVQKELHDT